MSPLPPIEFLNSLIKKKLYYKIVPTKEAELKKKINSDIGEQNIIIKKSIKKQLQAYAGFLANITND